MKRLLACVLVTAVLAPGCGKKKSSDPAGSSGGGSGDVAGTGGGAGGAGAGGAGAGSAGAGGALWTADPDPLQQAVLAATAETATIVGKKPSSLIGAVIDAATAAHKVVARDAWDPAAVIAAVGKDRVALFSWVRDKTALVPYRGSLRGAVGVMMDRIGNSFDRALLLADLLTKAGLEVRLANAQLDPPLVAKLATAWSSRPRPAMSTAHIDDAALTASIAKIVGVDPASLQAAAAKQRAAMDALVARTKTRVADQTKALGALVPVSGSAPDPAGAFADHWWVQVHDGEAWSDLDPSLPTASPGEALAATATETPLVSDIGDDRRHVITLRVIGEVWHDETREEATLVDYTFAPSQFFGQKVVVSNIALDLPDDKTLLAAKDRKAEARKTLVAQTEFAPMIRMGTKPVLQFSVNARGELLDLRSGDGNTYRLARAIQHATKDGVGGATDMLNQLPDETGSAAPPPAPKPAAGDRPALTAEWLEIEIKAPGAQPLIVRRTLFDMLGPVADRSAAKRAVMTEDQRFDRALQLLGETEVLPMFAQLPQAFVTDRTVQALASERDVVAAIVAGKSLDSQLEQLATMQSVPSSLYALGLARFADSSDVYLDRLDVLALRQRSQAKGTGLAIRQEADVIANAVAVWPSVKDPRAARIAQGIRDTDLEVIAASCPSGTTCSRAPSTSELFAASSGKAWSVVPTPQGAAATDRAAGYVIVAQGGTPRSWWRIDAATGETLGMNPMGGSEAGERAAIDQAMFQNTVLGFAALGKCILNYNLAPNSGSSESAVSLMSCTLVAVSSWAGANAMALAGGAGMGLALQVITTLAAPSG